ncbi:sulfite exporter TauE/SafE family protein [Oceaniglobus ichthyenteri]|uniref:sulfite exporter TauE/SafE family protein n=1 Tax=Oceaniglobus ichthyenteri TaxID=2136177 RepID=UPI000D3A0C18|nr:sulfite exporter TauE/SafE family protein [Oceaniglobus ichthyenteri]
MTVEFIVILLLGAAAGGFMNGLAGFGTALFAMGFWLQIMPPTQAVSVVVVVSALTGLQGVWLVRGSITDHPRRLARFLLPALLGIPLGVAALSYLRADTLKLIIAGFLILYGGFFTLRAALPKMERPTPVIDVLIGFAGGILGGATSLSGVLPTMWCAMRPWPKSETRAVLQPFNVAVLAVITGALAVKGNYTAQTLTYLATVLPVTVIFAQLGIVVFKRLSDDQFRRLLIALMLLSGLILMAREVVW